MIAKDVIFVTDEGGGNFYIPKDKLKDWNNFVDDQYFHAYDEGHYPDYATHVEGESYVVDIKEVL